VAGLAYWLDDWHAYRCCPIPHLHQGLDLMAARGTPLLSVANGVISEKQFDPVWSGLAVGITDRFGTRYLYFHMSAWAPGIKLGQTVRAGEVIGYVGNTGDAQGGPYHLHFEVHPAGQGAVPPKPYVDRWLDDAQLRAIKLVKRVTGKQVTDKDLNLTAWRNRLLELAKNELVAANIGAVLQVRAASTIPKPRAKPSRDQTAGYTVPVALLALLAGGLLFVDRTGGLAIAVRRRRRGVLDETVVVLPETALPVTALASEPSESENSAGANLPSDAESTVEADQADDTESKVEADQADEVLVTL
jgi:hypothetical protein